MAVTVVVDATWRLSHVEFSTPLGYPGTVMGHSEIVLDKPSESPPGEDTVLRARTTGETYGTMSGATITRGIDVVAEETVEVEGQTISLGTVVAALDAFMRKWRSEDAGNPPLVTPQAEALTPVPEMPDPANPRAPPN